ncbi:nitrogenase cofactor biosynthesis protein NifB [Acerihabitans sp. TG2]|uniref:nitrogenase cofactor biosynthesis protein NifB n=1 Tax=Acerihabitans sp. TG2 TaxID=3096008 RepID=UPI002B223588|nr:nitrogenase cofactor biosynthesis protein NifB [Acerihabitans sp. TG2]MEA9391010.1 nitrogenase cofactor biosynthesis protein NifB [Acerihabitans sp. TG2]
MASCDSSSTKSGCGSVGAADFSASLTPLQADKAVLHPCYSRNAHHRYARMHLAVAPACNLQCHYCNRKYDCSNESRPGVVSEVLTPAQAIAKARQVAAALPQLSVIGIAGPGDPLANIARTFNTLEGLRLALPDIKLCLSTNGLALPEVVDRLVEVGVDHVTVTVNALDVDIAAQIYPWLWVDGSRVEGREAAAILLERQQAGIRLLSARGVLVKINSVLIPGVNDHHLPAVSEKAREWGAFLHNVMPLISQPEHGTVYGLRGQREPTSAEVDQVRSRCGGSMPQMAHCQQCRADAIGMLGEDRSQSFPLSSVPTTQVPYLPILRQRAQIQAGIASQGESESAGACLVAVATRNGIAIDEHFGHVRRFQIYSVSAAGIISIGERFTPPFCTDKNVCEADNAREHEQRLTALVDLLGDMAAVFCARIGMGPWQQLEQAGIEPHIKGAWQPLMETVAQWWRQRETAADNGGANSHAARPDTDIKGVA